MDGTVHIIHPIAVPNVLPSHLPHPPSPLPQDCCPKCVTIPLAPSRNAVPSVLPCYHPTYPPGLLSQMCYHPTSSPHPHISVQCVTIPPPPPTPTLLSQMCYHPTSSPHPHIAIPNVLPSTSSPSPHCCPKCVTIHLLSPPLTLLWSHTAYPSVPYVVHSCAEHEMFTT